MPKGDSEHPLVVTEYVDTYLAKMQRPRDKVLSSLEADADKNDVPILGPEVGNFLNILARSIKAKNILEVGTATGYSGIWLVRVGAENGGKLTTVEMDPERKKIAEKAFRRAGLEKNVELILGDATKIIPQIADSRPESFDLVFMDVGEKKLYTKLLDPCVKALRKGGMFIADDTLYRGVAVKSLTKEKTRTMRSFNNKLLADKRLNSSIIPLGDGVTVCVKV